VAQRVARLVSPVASLSMTRRRRARDVRATLWVVALTALTACSGGAGHVSRVATTTIVSTSVSPSSRLAAPRTTTEPSSSPAAACISTREIDGWSIARRAMQLVVLPSLNFNVAALASLLRAGTGGVLFLGGAKAPSDLRLQLTAAVGSGGLSASPLVMADVEGGGVQRLSGVVEAFPWARELAATRSVGQVEQLAEAVGRQMVSAGVTVDLAPVVDLDDRPGPSSTNPDGLRSFSIEPATTSAYGDAFMQGLRKVGVVPVVKHFPGIGQSTQNTDYGPAATRPLSELRTSGLKPFIAAIAAKAPAIMISNAYVPGLTSEPASVSPAVIHDLLRTQLGFTGLVITDSLSAGAITAAGYTVPRAAVAAIEAGADLVLFGSTLTPADTALLSPPHVAATQHAIINALAAAVDAGDLTSARIDEAVTHVLIATGVTICGKASA
jgi:beta-N-acetylhexosaminidase